MHFPRMTQIKYMPIFAELNKTVTKTPCVFLSVLIRGKCIRRKGSHSFDPIN